MPRFDFARFQEIAADGILPELTAKRRNQMNSHHQQVFSRRRIVGTHRRGRRMPTRRGTGSRGTHCRSFQREHRRSIGIAAIFLAMTWSIFAGSLLAADLSEQQVKQSIDRYKKFRMKEQGQDGSWTING